MSVKRPKIVFSDFDGTLNAAGELLTPEFFEILNLLKRENIPLHIISGRSVSWGHFFLTHFPLAACSMEGGGVVITKDEKGFMQERYLVSEDVLARLEKFSNKLLEKFPGLKLTVDSHGRRSDRAIELYDLKDDLKRAEEIKAFMQEKGVHFSASNVHLNFWCGEISKAKAAWSYLEGNCGGMNVEDCLFFGDAPNDQSMFELFPHSVGVSNISSVLDKLDHKPSVVLEGEENRGPSGVLNYLKSIL